MNIAVVDDGGNLVAFAAMDDTKLIGENISQRKALTAVLFQMERRTSSPWCSRVPRSTASSRRARAGSSCSPAVCCCGRGGAIAGAVGVSAGTVDEDQQVAEAGRKACAG